MSRYVFLMIAFLVLPAFEVGAEAPETEKKSDAGLAVGAVAGEAASAEAPGAAGSTGLPTPAALIKAIEARNADLSQREAQVVIRERQIAAMDAEVRAMLDKYTKLREEVEQKQMQIDEAQEQKLVTLAKTYAAMPPEEAATRLEQMEENLALNILARSKPKIAAKFLGGMTPAKAAKLSLKLVKPPR